MAARLRKTHQDEVRTKIQTSQILNRLQNHVFGEVELSMSQIRAAEVVLKKALPDLSQVDANIEGEVGLTVQIVRLGDSDGAA